MTDIPIKNINWRFFINPHFWVIVVLIITLTIFYNYWPWRFLEQIPILSLLTDWAIIEFLYNIIGGLFIIPIIYGTIVFWWQGALIILLLSIVGILPKIIYIKPDIGMIISVGFLLLPLMAASLTALELKLRTTEKKMFSERERERQIYMSKVLETEENERRRIAHELHDDTIQTLIVIANQIETISSSNIANSKQVERVRNAITDAISSLQSGNYNDALITLSDTEKQTSAILLTGTDTSDEAEKAKETTFQTIESLRRMILNLRPVVLDELGLLSTLRWLVDRMNKKTGIATEISVTGEYRKLPPQTEIILFRVVQEALNNIRRHSNATSASIDIQFSNKYLQIIIKDNGHGFDPPVFISDLAVKDKFGLIGMEERIKTLNGVFKLTSRNGDGTTLFIEIKYG